MLVFVWRSVNASIKPERFNVRLQIRQKIPTNSGLLGFIKMKTFDQIRFRLIEYLKLHEVWLFILRLAVSQSENRAWSSRISCSRSSKISFCHWRIGRSTSWRQRSAHNISMASNFSASVIRSISITALGRTYLNQVKNQTRKRGKSRQSSGGRGNFNHGWTRMDTDYKPTLTTETLTR